MNFSTMDAQSDLQSEVFKNEDQVSEQPMMQEDLKPQFENEQVHCQNDNNGRFLKTNDLISKS